jgi:hypothetical protein
MNLTPAQINQLVEPLWQHRPECRPMFAALSLRLFADGWRYTKMNNWHDCDDQTAAERIEFAIDRALESESKKRDLFIRIMPNHPTHFIIEAYGFYDNPLISMEHPSRLAAKAMLLGQLWGVKVEVGTC